MKLPFRLFVVLLIPLLSVNEPTLSRQYTEYGTYAYPGYTDVGVLEIPYDPYGDQFLDFGAAENRYPWREPPDWAYDPDPIDPDQATRPDPYSGQVSGSGHRPYPLPGEGAGFRSGLPGYDYAGQTPRHKESGRAAASGFRFRGDAPVAFGGGGAQDWRGGYRFRPLTEYERQRIDVGTGWRPRGPDRVGERPRPSERMPDEQAYGYQPDSWFRRYYGVQP